MRRYDIILTAHSTWYLGTISIPIIFCIQCEVYQIPKYQSRHFLLLIPNMATIPMQGVFTKFRNIFAVSSSGCPDILCPITKCSPSLFIKMSVIGRVRLDTPFIPAFRPCLSSVWHRLWWSAHPRLRGCGTHHSIPKEHWKKSVSWYVCCCLSPSPAEALKFKFISTTTSKSYKGLIFPHSSLLEAGVTVVPLW